MRFKLSKRRVMNASLQNFSAQPTGVSRFFISLLVNTRPPQFQTELLLPTLLLRYLWEIGFGFLLLQPAPPLPPSFKIPQPWFVAVVVHIKVQDLSPNYFPYTYPVFPWDQKSRERGSNNSILCRNPAFPGQTQQQRFSLPT